MPELFFRDIKHNGQYRLWFAQGDESTQRANMN